MIKTSMLTALLLLLLLQTRAQQFRFAFVSDTHIGSNNADEDLRRTVRDINANPALQFVVLTGDITDFGADREFTLAKTILDSLNKPWYIIPGNHDANWSESGANSFKTIFGNECFAFTHGNFLFVGTSSGPNMRMGPGQVPREHIVFLDSVLNSKKNAGKRLIYLNHYPQDSAQNNWYEAIDRIKKADIELVLCGHGHSNHAYSFEGIPGVMGRSNLRAKDSLGGYNIVTFSNDSAWFNIKKPGLPEGPVWTRTALFNHHYEKDTTQYYRPSFSVNTQYPSIKQVWQYKASSDIGAGTAIMGDNVISTNTGGEIFALNVKSGRVQWRFKTSGKIYSTPAVAGNSVVVGSSDHFIYCLDNKGKLRWKVQTEKPVVASPIIGNNIVYIGASDGHFRAIDLQSGKPVWDFGDVSGFVVSKPLLYQGNVYFGCWNNDFYALDQATGKLVWKWSNGTTNRMYSPAVCTPVGTGGNVFIVAPDRYMTSFNAATGAVNWRVQPPKQRVRESMGLSADSSMIHVKTMEGEVYGVAASAQQMNFIWQANVQLGYELCPSTLVEQNHILFVPTHSGMVCAIDKQSGNVLWQHKISNCLVNSIMPVNEHNIIVSTMDGQLTSLSF
ncbi:outer membrane protein assembly factor BamB family protein [Deminuibacter soli]|uniref:Metallophosphoesterase n=1 Tax=Deminuibacter soli TaxID=2291815 RepID=A0A3E1NH36_9BACT|nr:PQQ-binding-like beta-propeller repeat protein [Deminuibacter soli]RFM27108.1 metallophosphoesterase [Deminuibacter soli]